MMKYKRLLSGLLIMAVFALNGFASDKVTEVMSSKHVAGKAFSLELTEDLVIGPDQSDDLIWGGFGSIVQVDSQGNMYVADILARRITKLDKNGKFLRKIGGQGQGPGEFLSINGFTVLNDDRSVIYQFLGGSRSLIYYDAQGEFLETKTFGPETSMLAQGTVSYDGTKLQGLYIGMDMAQGKMSYSFGVLGNDLKPIKVLSSFDGNIPNQQRMGDPSYWAEFIAESISYMAKGDTAVISFDTDGTVYSALSKSYRITHYDSEMQELMVFGRDYDPIPLSKEEIFEITDPILSNIRNNLPAQMREIVNKGVVEKAIEMAEFPPVKHPVSGIVCADKFTLVVHNLDLMKKISYFDIFNKKGAFVGQWEYPITTLTGSNTLVFKKDYAYNLIVNEDDETQLVRYKYALKAK